MADLSITAASVASSTDAQFFNGTAGATITAGQSVYLDSTTNTLKLADANASAATASVYGIALHATLSGQPLQVQVSGNINLGATLGVGTVYVQSATAGGIAPAADLASGWRTSVLCIGTSSSNAIMCIRNSGAAVP